MAGSVLERPTLVLNRSWLPIGVSTVARSLVKVWKESARIVDPDSYQLYDWLDWSALPVEVDELCIRTLSRRLRVPEVITLTHYDRQPRNIVAFSRRNVFKRDLFTCQYCGRRPGSEDLTIDHVIPRSRGGKTTWDNCVLACIACNTRKANRTPDESRMPLKRKPKRPIWRPVYASHRVQIDSWSKFISEAYWNVELSE